MTTLEHAPSAKSQNYSSSLLLLKGRGLFNSLARGSKGGAVFILLLVLLTVWGEVAGVHAAMGFLERFDLGAATLGAGPNIGLIVAQRLLEGLIIVLTAGVAFSSITTAISTLYLSDDLNFLLAQPIGAARVFAQKLLETFLSAAGLAALLTVPGIFALGSYFGAQPWFYPYALWLTLIVYALPVGLGATIAVLLMRVAPAGRVREIATGIGVLLSAGLIYFIRALRPEALLQLVNQQNLNDAQSAKLGETFNKLLEQFAGSQDTLLPPALAARALWDGARGNFNTAFWGVSVVSIALLLGAGWLAAHAYREGWIRGLEGGTGRLDLRVRTSSWGENLYARMGQMGHVLYKDLRLLLRDATQWSQLLILVALVGVYLISIRAYPLEGLMDNTRIRNVIGYLQMAFQSFVVAGVGIRTAFPALSLEGYGYWLLQTSPLSVRRIVVGKYLAAVPALLVISFIMAQQGAAILKVSPLMSTVLILVGLSSALVITALGVGLGAAFPRFRADNPSEIPMSPGGLLYMLLSLAYAALLAVLMAHPAFLTLGISSPLGSEQSNHYWVTLEGTVVLTLYTLVTVVGVVWPLSYGIQRLSREEV